jgi:hypothetical protein
VPPETLTSLLSNPVTASLKAKVIVSVSPAFRPAEAADTVTVGALVSRVKVKGAVPVPPALVSLATIVCGPSPSPVGVKVQAPLASAVVVAAIWMPSIVKCTTAFGSPESVRVGSLVSLSPAVPVLFFRLSVMTGGGVTVALTITTLLVTVKVLPW